MGCYCGEFFSGSNCEIPLCLNGGTTTSNNAGCICDVGYSGEHCQHVSCLQLSDDNFEEAQSAIGFVVRSSNSMKAQLNEIAEAADRIIKYYELHYPIFFQKFVLTVVSNNGIVFSHDYDTGEEFVASIRSLVAPPTETECDDALLAGLSQMLDNNAFKDYPNSPVFVFSDGTSNDDFTTAAYLMEQITNTRVQIFFMITDSASGSCNVDVSTNTFDQLRSISRLSRGLLIQTTLLQLSDATFSVAQDLWQYDTILTNDLDDCRKAPAFQPFFIDQSIDYLTLRATGYNLSPILTLPNNTQLSPQLFYSNGDFYVWRTANPPVGAYFLNINTNSTHNSVCQYRLMGRSTYRLYASVSDAIGTDDTYHAPVYQTASHLVARMDSLYLDDPLDVTLEAVIWYNDPQTSQRQLLYASSGTYRDQCQYEMYFGMFSCKQPYLPLYINIYTNDEYGQVVLRTATTYCSATIPNPVDSNCLNGGVYYNNTCQCPSHFTGDKCQQILCENGGNALFGSCQCPAGFSGQFCEVTKCYEYNGYGFWGFNHRSLTVMIHDSLTTRSTLRTLNDAAPRVINDILYQHPKWISNYQLVEFNSTDHKLLVDSTSGQDLVTGISNLYDQNRNHTGYSCLGLNFYSTLLDTISHDNVQWGGIVYVFLYGQPAQDLDSYQQILQRVEINKIQINIVQSSLNPCGQDIALDGLISLTQFSGGAFITATTPNAGNVFNQLPTHYMSNLIYEEAAADCTDTTFYIPIDVGTQSFTALTQGFLTADPQYIPPTDSLSTVTNVFNDLGTNARIDHIVRVCDDGWTATGSHCFKFSFEQKSWYAALADCHSEQAVLTGVFNQVEQEGLDYGTNEAQFWIGLSDILNPGQWEWDTLDDKLNLTLQDTQYTNWATGQPVMDNTKKCVLDSNVGDKSSRGWRTEDCTKSNYYVCQKHAYSADYTASDPEINHLARGIWKIRVKAQGACSISVRSQSTVQVASRFTTNIHDDVGREEPNRNADTNRLVVYTYGVKNQKGAEYAHFYYDNFTMLQAQTLSYRENCMYSFISTPFSCPNFYFQMLITGIDDSGYLYQRIVPAACIGGVNENSCTNGGVFYKGKCICTANFYGDSCQYAYCQNGGYLSATLDQCTCPSNWGGQFCQTPICDRNQLDVPSIGDVQRTFIVVLDGTNNDAMKTVNDNIEATLNSVLSSIQDQDPSWFTTFVGVVFRDAESIKATPPVPSTSKVYISKNSTEFATMLASEVKNTPYTAQQKKRDVFTGIVKAIVNQNVVPNSKVFVITAGNAEDTIDRQTVISALALSHSSVNFLFIGDTKPPGDATSYDDPTVNSMLEAAHITGGASYQLTSPEDLQNTWLSVLASLHQSYYVVTHQLTNCSNYQDYIQLDANGTEVIVDIFAQTAPLIAVFDIDNKQVDSFPIVKSKTNTVSAFKQKGEQPGVWTIDVDYGMSNSGPCTLNIRSQSKLEIDLGFTQDVASDGGYHDGGAVLFPRGGDFKNAIVADITTGGSLTYAQIYDLAETRIAWASPLIKRDGCAYPYVSQYTFQCYRNQFVVALDGFDFEGHPFRRTFTIHCDGEIRPQPTPPSPQPTTPAAITTPGTTLTPCDPSTAKVDIFIAFDSSDTITEEMYYATIATVKTIGNVITIGADSSRIVLGTYDAAAHFSGDLNTINNFDTYQEEVADLFSLGYTGINGNNIQSVLDYIVSENSTTPLRASPVRKLLVLLSSQGWDKGNVSEGKENGFQDPTTAAKNLKQAGLETFAIGLGDTANMAQLSAIAKCSTQVYSQADLTAAVSKVVPLLCGSTPQC
uniref:VWFA domain-containing protein n=1 Tax=Caenorhabditis tropicalis TaxID=1561998 RepID=A0A1I7U656_9PELO